MIVALGNNIEFTQDTGWDWGKNWYSSVVKDSK